MKILRIFCIVILVVLSGCGGCCPDPPIPVVKFEFTSKADTVKLGDTISLIDRSYCNHIEYAVSSLPIGKSMAKFYKDSAFGTFYYYTYLKLNYFAGKYYGDSSNNGRNNFSYDTTDRLQVKFIMDDDTGRYILKVIGTNTYTACVNNYPVNDNAPVETTVYDTIYVKRK